MLKIVLVIWVFISISLVSASETQSQIESLIALNHRPTMSEFLSILNPLPPLNPFRKLISDPYAKSLKTVGPRLIAELEHVYPGAIWGLLGRDSSLTADILESFYLLEGYNERVVRLDASRESFRDRDDYRKLLFSSDLVTEEGDPKKKFIILDSTRWQEGSQSKSLIQVVYKKFGLKNGALRQQGLIPFVNAINLQTCNDLYAISMTDAFRRGNLILPFFYLTQFLYEMSVQDNAPQTIFRTDNGFSYLPEYLLKGETYEIVWHKKFTRFIDLENGKVRASIGKLSDSKIREHVLWWMYEVFSEVRTETFKQAVETLARDEYGYEIQSALTRNNKDLSVSVIDWMEEATQSLSISRNDKQRELVFRVYEAFKNSIDHHYHLDSCENITQVDLSKMFQLQSSLPLVILPSASFLIEAFKPFLPHMSFRQTLGILKQTAFGDLPSLSKDDPKIGRVIESIFLAFSHSKEIFESAVSKASSFSEWLELVEVASPTVLQENASSMISRFYILMKADLKPHSFNKMVAHVFSHSILSPEVVLKGAKNAQQYLMILQTASLTYLTRKELILKNLKLFFELKPDIKQTNDLIQNIKKNGFTHHEIVTQFLLQTPAPVNLSELIWPKQYFWRRKNVKYLKVLEGFKMRNTVGSLE